MVCWDCGKRKGLVPAVEDRRTGTSLVYLICVICVNRWRPFLKKDTPAH
jgi:hypothetical protein